MKDENGFAVQGWMVNRLKLQGNELLAYALIYSFSQDGESYYFGSLKYLENWLSCSKPTAIKVLQNLTEKALIEKHSETRNSVTFNKYKAVLGGGKETLLGVKKTEGMGGKETLLGGGKETLPYIQLSDIKTSSNKGANGQAVAPSLFGEIDPKRKTLFKNSLVATFEKFKKQFQAPEFKEVDILYYFNSVNDWSDSKSEKRTSSGWVATARTWMRKDLEKGQLRRLDKKQSEDSDYQEYLKMGNESGY